MIATDLAQEQAFWQRIDGRMLYGGAERVQLLRAILAQLGHPEDHLKIVHLAGTNGKGSTGCLIASALRAQGYRVGWFTSPALQTPREQIVLDERLVTPTEILTAVAQVKVALAQLALDECAVSAFEWSFLLAVVCFINAGITWAVVETGLGGALDATNAIEHPSLVVFTPISYDHMAILGDTLTAIATTKSAIMRPGVPVISAPEQAAEVQAVLTQAAQANATEVLTVTDAQLTWQAQTLTGSILNVQTADFQWRALQIGLAGRYQGQNVLTALLALNQLPVTRTAIREGFAQAHLGGRLALVQTQPVTIADGAHNVAGAQALQASLDQLLPATQPRIYVVGILADKAYAKMLPWLTQHASQVIVTTPAHPERALAAADLAATLHQEQPDLAVQVQPDPQVALRQAQQLAGINGAVIVTGSFYLLKAVGIWQHSGSPATMPIS